MSMNSSQSHDFAGGLLTNASCLGNPGRLIYTAVRTTDGSTVVRKGPYAFGTNNIGEFLAVVDALAYCKSIGSTAPIYTSSQTAISWLTRGQARTSQREKLSPNLLERVMWAERWLATTRYENTVRRLEGA
jgi:ribonuclease HI